MKLADIFYLLFCLNFYATLVRIFNIIDKKYTAQFIEDNPLEYDDVNVLLICTKGKTDEELLEILKLLKDLAVKYDLVLCNPQSKEYVVDLTKDNSELTL